MAVNIRPLGDRVLVDPVESEETFAGGAFVLPETAKEKPQQGLVVAAGPSKYDDDGKRIPMDVRDVDRVLFAKYAGIRHPWHCGSLVTSSNRRDFLF